MFARPTASRLFFVLMVVTMGLFGTGCSAIFAKPPRQSDGTGWSDCSGYALPVVDTVFAGTHTVSALWVGANPSSLPSGQQGVFLAALVTDLVLGAVHIGSAAYGYSNAAKCERARARERGEAPLAEE